MTNYLIFYSRRIGGEVKSEYVSTHITKDGGSTSQAGYVNVGRGDTPLEITDLDSQTVYNQQKIPTGFSVTNVQIPINSFVADGKSEQQHSGSSSSSSHSSSSFSKSSSSHAQSNDYNLNEGSHHNSNPLNSPAAVGADTSQISLTEYGNVLPPARKGATSSVSKTSSSRVIYNVAAGSGKYHPNEQVPHDYSPTATGDSVSESLSSHTHSAGYIPGEDRTTFHRHTEQILLPKYETITFSKVPSSSFEVKYSNVKDDKPEEGQISLTEYGNLPTSTGVSGSSSSSKSSSSHTYYTGGVVNSDKPVGHTAASVLTTEQQHGHSPAAITDSDKIIYSKASSSQVQVVNTDKQPHHQTTGQSSPIEYGNNSPKPNIAGDSSSFSTSHFDSHVYNKNTPNNNPVGQASLTEYGNVPIRKEDTVYYSKPSSSHTESGTGYVQNEKILTDHRTEGGRQLGYTPNSGVDSSSSFSKSSSSQVHYTGGETVKENPTDRYNGQQQVYLTGQYEKSSPIDGHFKQTVHDGSKTVDSSVVTTVGSKKPDIIAITSSGDYNQNPQIKRVIEEAIERLSRNYQQSGGAAVGGGYYGASTFHSGGSSSSGTSGYHQTGGSISGSGSSSTITDDDIKTLIEAQLRNNQLPSVEKILKSLIDKHGSSSAFYYTSSGGSSSSSGGSHYDSMPLIDGQPKTNRYGVSTYYSSSSQTINGKTTQTKKGGVVVDDNGTIKKYEY